jgi:hypothetical protein
VETLREGFRRPAEKQERQFTASRRILSL